MRPEGLEPPRVAPQDPKSCASTSSATVARQYREHSPLSAPREMPQDWYVTCYGGGHDPSRLHTHRAAHRARDHRPRRGHCRAAIVSYQRRSEEHTSELQSRRDLVCRLLLEKKNHEVRKR